MEVRAAVRSGEAQRLRVAAQLSIGEVAHACGVDQSTVWRWEKGKRRPRGSGALAYAGLIASLRERSATTEARPA
ncbi:helix-turn-helix domain-containing protein [Streptomyces sp. NBRC 109706]|uniref:helix-turn-helix domain-containing protein n=1 Tax=Streptomyces sp. NBRC 109706 TaxID=1550035 RepID=UPI00351C21E1